MVGSETEEVSARRRWSQRKSALAARISSLVKRIFVINLIPRALFNTSGIDFSFLKNIIPEVSNGVIGVVP